LSKIRFKFLQKIPFEEGQVQDPIPALPGYGLKIPAVQGDTEFFSYIQIFNSLGAEMAKKSETDGWTEERFQ
jgi:hypothetical protein